MTKTDDGFRLSTGLEFYAHAHLLAPEKNGDLAYGYDGHVWIGDRRSGQLTDAERKEIAEYMIREWITWAGAERENE